NFGDQLFFNKSIAIINGADTVGEFSDPIKYSDSALEISFFPEGGSLVDNVSSIVAFKAVNITGSGCNVSGEVYSSAGDLITTFRSTHLGMSIFTLKPVSGLNYYAVVKNSEGDVIKREIPKSFSKGFVLNARINELNEYLITLKTNPETLPRFLGRSLLVTVSAHKKYLKALIVKIDTLDNSFILPAEELPDGIVMITLFGLDNHPLCERLIYVQNNEGVNVKIETDKKVYKQRDSVAVKLSLLEDFGTGQEVFLSLSATENIYTIRASQFPSTISSWFLLESDVHGPVEEPSYYFDSSNPDRLKDLDLLLLTQGWRDFEWKYKGIKYLPESGFTISGRLRKSLIDVPLINSNMTIGIFQGKKSIITTVQTDSSGRFHLDLDNLIGSAKVIVSATDQKGNFKGRVILDSLDYSPAKIQVATTGKFLPVKENQPLNENLTFLKEMDLVKKSIRKKYTLSDTILIDEVKIVGKRKETQRESHVNQSRTVYGQPDKEVIITPELESFRSIKDLLIGRVAGVYSVKQGSGIRIRGYGSSFEMGSEPLFVLDGIVVSYAEISTIPLHWIDRVDVIMSEKAAAYGVRGANGVISVITKTSGDITYKPVSYSVSTKISGYDAPRIFYSPKHSSTLQSDYRPDLRSNLYWFPNIKVVTNKDYLLKYFNADISSTYKIIVEGITSSGIPVTGKIEYEVK
ncbi:MAG: TonB-dependent receptor plug domain-containing protein, partial [Bacteroidales bacterium]|nr:TonB-dependent receptor plug domain-containing protein [Bacteroidales bacterium]